MFAAASSFFARTNISQNYNVGTVSFASGIGSRSSTPGPSGANAGGPSSSTLPAAAQPPTFQIGPWKVQPAVHKTNGKRVSVWSFDKRSPEIERLSAPAKERVMEVLKAEASALGRLRHPQILEMVEPLEETRSEFVFATELLLSSLSASIPGASRSSFVELDEVEIQKGVLQLCKGLSFLHTSARRIHSNLSPDSILINNAGDWKIGGLGLTIPLQGPDGKPTRWEYPTFDGRAPNYIQRSFDFMAPEYALDEILSTESDMYSLGCVLYAVHCKGVAPFRNHGSLSGLRDNAGKPIPGLEPLDRDLQSLLRSLVTRSPPRPSPTNLPNSTFFSSLSISTLNFLDRSNFATKSREEKISFMKGLTSVLDRFSEGLRVRKILPSLVEEMKDTHLLPYILPNVFAISAALSPTQFAAIVLPSLKPLFAIKEPPQNMLTLLDNLQLLQDKTEKGVFREHVLPLVYNALESEHAIVQERALAKVPDLCESIDYAEVQGVLFPRVAYVFTKTNILSVKVATLVTFLAMVKTLDQSSLTQKLVPLLSKIRTKEPLVMVATLSVQEAMGMKVDREAVATLVLPQLWAMSMGPLLSLGQFERFMAVIKKLGDRVEREHNQYLRDSQRLEDRSTSTTSGPDTGALGMTGGKDFASLVGSGGGAMIKPDGTMNGSLDANAGAPSWEDDVWGSILNSGPETPQVQSPTALPPPLGSPMPMQTQSVPGSPRIVSSRPMQTKSPSQPYGKLGARAVSSASPSVPALSPPMQASSSFASSMQPMQPNNTGGLGYGQPSMSPMAPAKPNYNVALSPAPAFSSTPPSMAPQSSGFSSFQPMVPASSPAPAIAPSMFSAPPSMSSPPLQATPPSMGGMLAPMKPANPTWGNGAAKKPSNNDWGDFDPLA